jgi:hypothetical protein
MLAILFASAAGGAAATAPVQLDSSFVVDQAGVLSASEEAAVEQRLQQLSDDTDVDLWVVYVDTFTDPADAEEWANTTADENGLGPNQYLLAVATEGRQFFLSGYSEGPVSFDQLGAIEQQRVQPALAQDDWAGAASAAADGLQDAAGGGSGGAPGEGGGFGGILMVIVVVAGIALVIWLIVRRRRGRGTQPGGTQPQAAQIPTAELVRRAGSALVETDDAIKTSEQELGFARAQFGDEAAAEFEQALASARQDLDQAFSLKQKLDDADEDSEADVRAWNGQIIQLCERANSLLDEKAQAFDELRKLEQNAPEALARVQEERTVAAAALADADARLQTLASAYAAEALATVVDNPAQARDRIAFADENLAAAEKAIAAGDGGEAAVSIRAAEEAVGQAELLEQAIDKLATDLAEGEKRAAALLAELDQDLAAARALPDQDGRVAAAIVATTQQMDAARANLAAGVTRPLLALQGLEAANAQIDGVIAGVRDAAARDERARQMLGQVLLQAQAQVSAAEDYITARRGAVGAQARTRLAEAGAALVQAQQLQTADPTRAMEFAQRSNQLAGQAIQLAQSDVGSFGGGGSAGGGHGSDSGGGMLGAVLGGIVINSLLGGGGRSSGGMGGMFGGGGSGGGFSPGSFGGGGTRSRRGGGRF